MTKPNNIDPLDEILNDYANFKVWESQQTWKSGYDREANIANSRNRAKAAIQQLLVQERLEARIAELQQLVDFVAMAKFYDQDSAMKLRYHLDKRIAALRSERSQLTPKED